MIRRVQWGFLALGLLLLAGAAGADATGDAPSASLEQILSEFDRVQAGVQTLSAEFTETKVSELLKEPIVSQGRFYMTKPNAVMWEYTAPESMQFVIANDEYVGYYPKRKRAERRNVRRWTDQIFRYFGLGQGSAELKKFYDIRLGEDDASMNDTYVLVLEPRKRRVKKRMQDVRIWVDEATHLPVRVQYSDKAGNTREVHFAKMELNPVLSTQIYNLDIPSDVTVTTGITGLGAAN
jgi:outer membrane lipoprotein-sorting protein